MSDQQKPFDDLKALEAVLASLAPRTDRLDRDRLMFLAGQASVHKAATAGRADVLALAPQAPRWAWPAAFSAMTALAASLFVALLLRPDPQVVVVTGEPAGVSEPRDRALAKSADPSVPIPRRNAASDLDAAYRTGLPASLGLLAMAAADAPSVPGELRWLDQVLGSHTGPESTHVPSELPGTAAEPPASYRRLRENLLNGRGGPAPSARPSFLELFSPLGARS